VLPFFVLFVDGIREGELASTRKIFVRKRLWDLQAARLDTEARESQEPTQEELERRTIGVPFTCGIWMPASL
jgi:hypothetical protein